MKKDLISAILAAIVGVVLSFLICNVCLPELKDVSLTALDSNIDYSLPEPNDTVFNYRALNPTVEVYVGNCSEYDSNGICLDESNNTNLEEEDNEDPTDEEETGEDDDKNPLNNNKVLDNPNQEN